MAKPDWDQVKSLFHTALLLPQEERSQFVRVATAGNAVLAAEVESLLSAHAADPQFEPVCDRALSGLLEDHPADPMTGKQVGRYRLKARLGSGGMAHVFLAERTDGQLPRPVAVKIIKQELDDKALRRRFENEKRALATLDTPTLRSFLTRV